MQVRVCALLLALALAAVPAAAQEQRGSVEGVVKDASGAVLPGVNVTLQSAAGAKLETVTDATGVFRFPSVAPTTYTVTAALSGFTTQTASDVSVTLGQARRIEFTMPLAGVTESVSVTARSPVIDVTSSATATNISREQLEYIPRGRDFTDVVSQAAGASDESQAGGISIDGSSGSENRFVIDGIDTTSPQVGTNAVPLRAEFMEEVQVKSAGYAAEYGGSTGGVVNAITRSGSNEFHGSVLSDFESNKLNGDERPILIDADTASGFDYVHPPKDDETRVDPGFSLGGPILRNRLFFFGSYQPGIRSTKRTVTFDNGDTNTFNQDFRVDYGAVNVSGNAGSKLLFRAGGNFSPYETKRSLPTQTGQTSLTSPDDYLRGTKGQRRTFSGSVDWVPTTRLTVSGRVGRFLTDEESTGVEFPGLIHNISTSSTAAGLALIPAGFPNSRGYTSDVLITDATAFDQYTRDYISVDATYFLNAGGEHQIKGGFQTERIGNDVQSGYNADRIIYYGGLPYAALDGNEYEGTYGTFRLLNISTQGAVASRNDALFVQDSWRVRQNLTLNFGLRTEHERVPNFGDTGVKNPIEFNYADKLAPRVGFSYDPFSDGNTKIYGSWGKYYDVMKYEMPRGSFGGDKWVDYWFTWDNPNVAVNSASGCATGTNTIDERPSCPGGTFIEAFDQRHNAAEDLDQYVEPNLKPLEQHEVQVGGSRQLSFGRMGNVVLGARYVHKNLIRTIEDVGVNVAGVGTTYYIANPGEGITLSLNDPSIPAFPKAKRVYDAVEITLDRRLSNHWGLFLNYTESRLYGNYSGLASSDENGRTSPNVERLFDNIQNMFDRNGNLVYGRLGTDRPHQFKAQGIYQFDWNMTLGVNQRISSGIPVSEEASVTGGIPFFPYGRGNKGRTDALITTDLQLLQRVPLGGDRDIEVGMTVLNLFDRDAPTRLDNTRTLSSLPVSPDEFFSGFDYEAVLAANPSRIDPKWLQPNQFQAPRQFRFSVKFRF
jgi:outer membrane receptor protein involved in Fe transport